jgi:hypothetical protein
MVRGGPAPPPKRASAVNLANVICTVRALFLSLVSVCRPRSLFFLLASHCGRHSLCSAPFNCCQQHLRHEDLRKATSVSHGSSYVVDCLQCSFHRRTSPLGHATLPKPSSGFYLSLSPRRSEHVVCSICSPSAFVLFFVWFYPFQWHPGFRTHSGNGRLAWTPERARRRHRPRDPNEIPTTT